MELSSVYFYHFAAFSQSDFIQIDVRKWRSWGFLGLLDYTEGLIYDFGVNPGDSIEALNIYINSNNVLNYVVTEVDSVLLLDRYRKRVSLYEYNNQKEEVWVEGLGGYFGILNSYNDSYGLACGGYLALCYEEDNMLVYQDTEYETCYYAVTTWINSSKSLHYRDFPSPTKDFVSISFPDDGERLIEIWDFFGKIIIKDLYFQKNILLNLQEVDNGTYIIKISDSENYCLPYKLIVD